MWDAMMRRYSQCLIDVMDMDGKIQVPLRLIPFSDQIILHMKWSEICSLDDVSCRCAITLSLNIDEVDQVDLESHGSPDHAHDV
jgi:hypothetical protein